MKLQLRRVVTGHTADGRAVVKIDEPAKNVIGNRPGVTSCVVWSTKGFPSTTTTIRTRLRAHLGPRLRVARCSASCATSRASCRAITAQTL